MITQHFFVIVAKFVGLENIKWLIFCLYIVAVCIIPLCKKISKMKGYEAAHGIKKGIKKIFLR